MTQGESGPILPLYRARFRHGGTVMRKILAPALIALALAGGVTAGTSLLSPQPAHADCNGC
jgi:hypothetical protein